MNWELLLKTLGIIVGVVASLYKLRRIAPKSRSVLRTDLEILKLLEPSDPNYPILKSHIDVKISNIYHHIPLEVSKRFKVYNWYTFIFGIIMFLGFSIWTVYLVKDGFSWWALLTGSFAFAGVGNILGAFTEIRGGVTKRSFRNL